MSEVVQFNGRQYNLQKSGYYVAGRSSRTEKPIRLHIAVWESVHGKVPEGCVIHHADHNKKNNSIINLLCWKKSFHQKYHILLVAPERTEILRQVNLCKKHSEETKAKMSKAQKGKKRTDETKAAMSIAHAGQQWSKEARLKNSISQTGSIKSKQTIEKMKTAAKLVWDKRKGVVC